MVKVSKSFVLIIAAQAVCLALGLWTHDRFVISAAQWSSDQQSWDELVESSRRALDFLPPLEIDALTSDRRDFAAAQLLFDAFSLPEGSVALLVDADWRFVLARGSGDEQADQFWRQGKTVDWNGPRTFVGTERRSNHGSLQTPVGQRQALAYPLKNSEGYVLFSHAKENRVLSIAALSQAFPLVRVLSFVWIFVLQSIIVCAILSRIRRERSHEKNVTIKETLRRNQELVRTRDAVIFGLAKLAESRDRDTGHHLERISLYSTRLASAARRHKIFRDTISPPFVREIGISSALHDIGKVGIEDAVLVKPGRLNEHERRQIQKHPIIGSECISEIEQRLGTSNFLEMAQEIALHHHEWWNGSGYPFGVVGEQIPLSARIVAIVDVYDAMSLRRVYKEPIPHDECVAYILEQAGKQFDPDLVEVFLKIEHQFRDTAQGYVGSTVVEKPSNVEKHADEQTAQIEFDEQPDHPDEFLNIDERIEKLTSQLTNVL